MVRRISSTVATRSAARGGPLRDAVVPSQVRVSCVGKSVQYPLGTPLTRMRGENYAIWNANIASDAATAASEGQTLVRLLLRWYGLYGDPTVDSQRIGAAGQVWPLNLNQHYREVKSFTDQGIWVDAGIDSNCACNGGVQGADSSNIDYCTAGFGGAGAWPQGRSNFTDPVLAGQHIELWKQYVRKMCPLPRIWSWELCPEPMIPGQTPGTGITWDASWIPVLLAFYRKLIGEIHKIDPYTPITAGARGNYKLSNVFEVLMAEFPGVFYTGDALSDIAANRDTFPGKVAPLVSMRDTNNVTVYMQSVGVKTGDDNATHDGLRAALALFNTLGIPWTYWSRHQNGTSTTSYGLDLDDGHGGYTLKEPDHSIVTYYVNQTLAALEAAAIAAATAEGAFLFYVKSDLTNVWTDTAGTVQATLGDAVARIDPVVGNPATLVLQQATSSLRPILMSANAAGLPTGDNLPVLNFDGVDDMLQGSVVFFASGDEQTVGVSGQANGAGTQIALHVGNSLTNARLPFLGVIKPASNLLGMVSWRGDDTVNREVDGTMDLTGRPVVLSASKKNSTTTETGLVQGIAESAPVVGAVGSIATLTRLRVGANTQGGQNWQGPLAVIWVCRTPMSDAHRQDLERFAGYRGCAATAV